MTVAFAIIHFYTSCCNISSKLPGRGNRGQNISFFSSLRSIYQGIYICLFATCMHCSRHCVHRSLRQVSSTRPTIIHDLTRPYPLNFVLNAWNQSASSAITILGVSHLPFVTLKAKSQTTKIIQVQYSTRYMAWLNIWRHVTFSSPLPPLESIIFPVRFRLWGTCMGGLDYEQLDHRFRFTGRGISPGGEDYLAITPVYSWRGCCSRWP